MAWIKTVEETEAKGLVNRFYDNLRKDSGLVPNIVKAQSLKPETMRAVSTLYRTLMFGPSKLSRAQREMIALVVSAINRCHY